MCIGAVRAGSYVDGCGVSECRTVEAKMRAGFPGFCYHPPSRDCSMYLGSTSLPSETHTKGDGDGVQDD